MRKVLLVDGYSIMYRSHFAYAGRAMLTAPDGTPTGALSGFFNSFFSVVDEYQPTDVCVLFDVHAPTFRHKLSEDYKATRKPMPDELRTQIPILKTILDKMGIARLEKEGFEADDLIGTLSKRFSSEGDVVFIYSGDHDDYQLIDQNVSVVLPQSGKGKPPRLLVTREVFEEMYGVSPERFIYVKALMGDNSDNIKGIDKVGEKTAFKLISDYGDIDNIYANLESIKGTLKDRLTGQEEHLALSLKLCTIDRDVDVETPDTNYEVSKDQELMDELSRLGLKAVIKKLGMTSMKASLPDMSGDMDRTVFEYAGEIDGLAENISICKVSASECASKIIGFENKDDEPFYSIAFFEDMLLVALRSQSVVYAVPQSEADTLWSEIVKGGVKVLPVSIDYKTNNKVLAKPIEGLKSVFDVMICAYVLNRVSGNDVSFETIYERTLGLQYPIKSEVGQISLFEQVSENEAQEKAAANALLSVYVAISQFREIKENKIEDLLFAIEFPLVITLDRIERNGMHVSSEELKNLHEEFKSRIDVIENKIYELTGQEFLISSPKQLSRVLFEDLGLKHGKKSKTGSYSTSIEVLNSLRDDHPVIPYIIDYRSLTKLDSTYATGLSDKIGPDGRIRTTFTQALTNTGRLSSTEPNLQNIPVRTSEGERIRNAFTAPEGRVLVDADYSQIELRLLASMSHDEVMMSAFNEGQDIHRRTASRVFGVDEADVTSKQRSAAKTVNFSIIYGVTEYGLSQDLGCTYIEAKELIKSYYQQFPRVHEYLESLKKKGEELGYADTLFGRRRYLHELASQNKNLREFGYRVAMNTPIQGTAADIIKIAMNRVNHALLKQIPDAKLVMQVHDELIVECSEADSEVCAKLLKEEMEKAVKLNVPLIADCNIGHTWLEAK